MASAMIHIAVANEVNKTFNRDEKKLFIGSIAPDIAKLIGDSKIKSHFASETDCNIPNMDYFLKKYKDKLDDDFVLGYYIHLYTDYLWFKYFITEIMDESIITRLNGEKIECNGSMMKLYIYNDYTNLNVQLIDKYNLDLKIFYEDLPSIDTIIDEIPMDKLNIVVDKMGVIIANSKEYKEFVFNLKNIEKFISTATELIVANILELKNNR